MLESFREISENREFLREYVLQNLRSKYRGSILGLMWTLMNPVLLAVSWAFIFGFINRIDIRDFLPYFLASLTAWAFFQNTASMANFAIIGNAAYVSRMYVPKGIFPLAYVLVNLIELLAGLVVLILLLLLFFPHKIQLTLLFVPVSVALLFVFVTGVAFLFSTLNVFFRDFQFLWNTMGLIWFFLTPVLYTVKQMPEHVRPFFDLNIMYPFVRLFHDPIAWGVLPPVETVFSASLYAVITFVLGTAVFFRWQRQFYMYV